MRTTNDWANPVYGFTWWTLSRGLYQKVFGSVGFDLEFVTSVARLAASGEAARPTIIALRRGGPILETFTTCSEARATLLEQQRGGGPRSLSRVIRFWTRAIRAHDNALRKHTLSFTAPPGPWHYAVLFYCNEMSAGTAVELDVQVESGVVGVGFNGPALSHYISEEIFIRRKDGRKKVRIVLADPMCRAVLVVRNASSDGESQGTVFSLDIVK